VLKLAYIESNMTGGVGLDSEGRPKVWRVCVEQRRKERG